MNNLLPKARIADIIEQAADKDLLIYDLRTNKMFQLNETSRIVYQACGKRSFDELKREYQLTDDLIHFALAELVASDLIEDYQTAHFAGLSRREVIRRVGLATMVALPVIAGLTAPKAAQAASGCAAANAAVSTQITNPSGDTTTNQNFAGQRLSAQCCTNSYRNFISTGCSSGIGETCFAQAICN